MDRFGDERDWFFEKRFGLFLHLGLYTIEGWHEQDQMRRFIPRAQYARLIDRFNPDRFDPNAILDLAESVGMEYVCLTTKHHDGFCLWDTACTDFNVTNSPYGQDIIRQMADACHRRGFPLGLYYSIADWHHPSYPNEGRHHELQGPEPGDVPDWARYVDYVRDQVRELCTNYGQLHMFWWDMNVPKAHDPSINQMLRRLQPGMVINNRGFDDGDFGTPEREYQAEQTRSLLCFERPTEACNSLGTQSWGFRKDEDYQSIRYLLQNMTESLARGGNYLLNASPDASGCIPEQATAMLRTIGNWYSRTRKAFVGCEPASELSDNRDVLLTRRGTELYVHMARPPRSQAVVLQPLSQQPARATLLNTGDQLETSAEILPVFWDSKQPLLRIKGLPVDSLAHEPMVVHLDFSEPVERPAIRGAEEFRG